MKKLALISLVALTASGGGCSTQPSGPPSATTTQLLAFEKLQATTETTWRWVQNETLRTPLHLSTPRTGKVLLRDHDDAARVTIGLLAQTRELFTMRDPSAELVVEKTFVDALGMTHARFQQMTHGIPVAGAELSAHYDALGHIASIDATYVAGLDGVDVNPSLTAGDAFALAKQAVGNDRLEHDGEDTLLVHTRAAGEARLAYRVTVRAMEADVPAVWVVTVDAKTGELLERYDDLQTVQAQGVGVLGDTRTFEVTASGGGYVMTDASGGAEVRTFTAQTLQATPGTQVASDSLTSWDTGVPGAGAAVDAHTNAVAVYKYFKDRHGRNAIDGIGGALVSTAHFGKSYDNASWDGRGMIYGDGGAAFRPLSVSLDVVAHEFTHGVTQRTSKLAYMNQSGALNEAVSDIFGAFIEHVATPDATRNWLVGEALVKAGPALRDMKNPIAGRDPQPSHMSQFVNTQQDNGGVHINSGIVNNAAFLMTVGGVNPVSKVELGFSIGWDRSEKLWYRANTVYFQSTTNFALAAEGVMQAAKDLAFNRAELDIVDCAFKATGITPGTCAPLVDPLSAAALAPAAPVAEAPVTGTPVADAPAQPDAPATEPRRVRRAVTSTSSGCDAAPPVKGSGVPALLAVVGLVALCRLSRKRP